MNKYIPVSIAGVAFKIEDKGFALLGEYLDHIKKSYGEGVEGKEILNDIEARIAELLLSEPSSNGIVSTELIQRIIQQMGLPEEEKSDPTPQHSKQTFARRLYRNPETGRIGSVCSGLATYFDTDPVIMRLIWLLPLMLILVVGCMDYSWEWLENLSNTLFTISVLGYLLLWFAVPMARTPRQKLEMYGERITAESIKRNISQDSQSMNRSKRGSKVAGLLTEIVCIIGRILLIALKIVLALIGFCLIMAALAVLIFILLFALNTSAILAITGPVVMTGLSFGWYALVVLAIILLTLIGLCMLFFKLVLNVSISRTLMTILLTIWLLLGALFIVTTIRNISTLPQAVDKIEQLLEEDYFSIEVEDDSISIKTFSQEPLEESTPLLPASQIDITATQSDSAEIKQIKIGATIQTQAN